MQGLPVRWRFKAALIWAFVLGTCALTSHSGEVNPSEKARLHATPALKDQPAETNLASSTARDRLSFHAGGSAPFDDGRGYPRGYAYILWKRGAWPWTSTDFKLAFAGIAGDAELSLRNFFAENTDLGFGANYQTIGRFEEYQRGQIDIGNRMGLAHYSGRVFVHQHVVVNFVEIAQVRATYESGYQQFYHQDDTAPTFRIANSGFFQTAKLNAGTGKVTPSLYEPSGWNLNLGAEATFRSDWKSWGPPNRFDSPSQYQKFKADGTYVASSWGDQKLTTKITGGVGNGLDRLSNFKLGGSLSGFPDSLVLHGFYVREIMAEDFGLLNFDYVIPLLKEQQLAAHLYADGAVTRRTDIPDRQLHGWVGSGAGLSFKGWWETEWLVGFGYGINAQRGSDHGSQEIFAQMSKPF